MRPDPDASLRVGDVVRQTPVVFDFASGMNQLTVGEHDRSKNDGDFANGARGHW
jgi:hypothetical protein